MPKMLPDDEIAERINSLNSKQREVFNAVHIWTKDLVKYNGHNVEPVYIFFSGSGGSGKFHLVKIIYNTIPKTVMCDCEDLLLLGPTGTSAVNINGTIIHYDLGIKNGTKLIGVSDKSKTALRNRLSEVKF